MFYSILDCHFKYHPFITQNKEHYKKVRMFCGYLTD